MMSLAKNCKKLKKSQNTMNEEEDKTRHPLPPPQSDDSLAAKAIQASSAHRDSSLSSAYSARGAQPAVNSSSPTSSLPSRYSNPATTASSSPSSKPHEYTSLKNVNESKHGFSGVLARKAKAILDDDDNGAQDYDSPRTTRADRRPHPFSALRFFRFQELGQHLPRAQGTQAVPAGGGDFPRQRQEREQRR
ncbi:hypothetical protein ACFX11_003189 [Malus domestica]